MNPFGLLTELEGRSSTVTRVFGAVVAIVTNNQDPDKLGRVKLRFPWLSETEESHWARIAAPMAGKDRGMYFLPEVDDEVLVAFEHGDLRFPYVLGGLWNGVDTPPAANDDGKNSVRLFKSRSGHVLKFNDEEGSETIEIIDKGGKNSIVIDTASNTMTITTDKDINFAAGSGTVKIDASTIKLKSSGDVSIEASGSMVLKAGGTLTIKGATVNIN